MGVDDRGGVTGVTRKDMEEWIVNICRNNCHPSLIPIIETVKLEEKTVVAAIIRKREGMVHRSSDGHYYIRVGSTVRDATPEELARLFQASGFVHHDVSPVYKTSLKDLDLDRLNSYFTSRLGVKLDASKKGNIQQLLANIKAMVKLEGKYLCTIAGLLVFGHHPESHLSQAGITAVKFNGVEMDYNMEDKKDIAGPLINKYNPKGEVVSEGAIEQAISFVRSHATVSSRMKGVRRAETPQYPMESIREAIVNAVAHRNYTITGSKIRLFLFSDRLEIHSPGRLPNTVTIENAKSSAHYTRNPELYKLLGQHGYTEDIGLGIPRKIIQKMLESGCMHPLLEERGEEFVLVLFPAGRKK
jgi:ATP-dependent DNA helicase RecG